MVARQAGSARRLSAQSDSAPPDATTMAPGEPAWIVGKPHGHVACRSRGSTERHEADIPTGRDQVVIERTATDVRQRLRCQDLPSVWVDGA